MKKYGIIFIFFLFIQAGVMAQAPPPPPNGGGGGDAGPSCWPPSPTCDPAAPVPINEGLLLLVIAGLGVVFLQNKKKIIITKTQ